MYRFFDNKADTDTDELVQETFLACLSARDKFERKSTFRTYMFAIARYTLYGYWRKRSGKEQLVDFDNVSIAALSTTPGTRLAAVEDQQRLLAALRLLPLAQHLPKQ